MTFFYYRICVFVYVLTPSNNNNNNSVIPLVEFTGLIPKKLDLYVPIYLLWHFCDFWQDFWANMI